MKNRRLAVLASACGLLLVVGTPAAATPSAPTGSSAVTAKKHGQTKTSPVRIATYNTQYGRSPAAVVSDIESLRGERADVIGLQEMGSPARRQAVRQNLVNCDSCKYAAFMPDTREQNATPILYKRNKFKLLSSGGRKVSDSTFVGASGAGPSRLKAKFVNYVELRHLVSGQVFYVLNSHAVPSVQGDGGGRNTHHQARLRLYRQHMEGLTNMISAIKEEGVPVFSAGDFNVNYRRDSVVQDTLFPYYNMGQLDVHASYERLGMPEGGTHTLGRDGNGTRLIDYVFSLDHPLVTPKEQQVLSSYGSDHRPVVVRYALTR